MFVPWRAARLVHPLEGKNEMEWVIYIIMGEDTCQNLLISPRQYAAVIYTSGTSTLSIDSDGFTVREVNGSFSPVSSQGCTNRRYPAEDRI